MKIFLTGALGQIGSELTIKLRSIYGNDNVVISDVRDDVNTDLINSGPFYKADCRDSEKIHEIVRKHSIDRIYHLAALLSATAEKKSPAGLGYQCKYSLFHA